MWRVEQALQRITGAIPAFMRPPYGEYNGATPAQSKKLYDAVIKKKPSTILTLNHDIFKGTAYEFVPYAIEKLQKAGYK
ncbi:Carbohydrate esterase 4 protein [Ceratobasidium sp. 392]|nr:Carbohydrate esterase 4 protein [Ceratobasidium sp. 392]